MRLAGYSWPGNVRELENCLESAVVIMDGDTIRPEDLPLPERESTPPPPGSIPPDRIRTLAEVEREHILTALSSVEGNRSEAARLLGIGRNTLARKLREFGR
jgi:Nif-specific regulatory protein